ncbi:hypothetical protein [Morganella morganii IS15]|nr:hypothetical protein CSB69_4265 [Morganella morganii]EMP51379.1 hypothetical protein C790_01094 [Morganella morganii SC01]CDK64585.1 hypothetical protein [Morganella morganii IS15]
MLKILFYYDHIYSIAETRRLSAGNRKSAAENGAFLQLYRMILNQANSTLP